MPINEKLVKWDDESPAINENLVQWQDTSLSEQPSMMQQAGAVARDLPKQLGLATRYGLQGLAAGTAGIVTDPLAYIANRALGTNLQTLRGATGQALTAAGLPQPQTPTERVVGEASELLSGTGGILKGISALTKQAPQLAQALAPITARPGLQASSAIGSGLAGGEARELGASPLVQGAASLLGGLGVPVTVAAIDRGVGKAKSLVSQTARPSTGNIGLDIARAEKLSVPPTMTNPSVTNRLLEGFSGKLTTGQALSLKNQEKLNNLAKAELGLPKEVPLSRDTLNLLRRDAGDAYSTIKGTGLVTTDQAYEKALNNITQKYQGAAKDFPELAKNEAVDIVNSIKVPQFNSDSAVDAISVLRSNADDAFAKGNKSTGKAYREAAGAIEDLLGRHLQAIGAPEDIVSNFQNARTIIAKTYSVENALNPVTNNIIGSKLAKQLEKGKPLSGNLKKIAQFSSAFPTASKEVTSSMPGLSPLDYATGGLAAAATQNPALLAATMSRPLVRSLITSRPYQSMMTTPGQTSLQSPFLIPAGLQGGLLLPPENQRNNY